MRELLGFASYPLVVAFAAAVAAAIAVWIGRQRGLSLADSVLVQLTLITGALAGAKAYAALEASTNPGWHPGLGMGFRYPGAVFGAVAALPFARMLLPRHVSLGTLGDAWAPAVPLAMAIVRIGCLAAGCCHGAPTDSWVGLTFPKGTEAWSHHVARGYVTSDALTSLPVVPLQVFLAVWSAAVATLCYALVRAKRLEGRVIWVFVLFHESGKALLESLRDPFSWHLQVASIALAVVALLRLAWLFAQLRATSAPLVAPHGSGG